MISCISRPRTSPRSGSPGTVRARSGAWRALPEPGVVRRDHVNAGGEALHELFVLSRRARESVQEQQGRSGGITSLSVEDLAAVSLDRSI